MGQCQNLWFSTNQISKTELSKRPKVSAEVKPAVQTPLSTEPSNSVSEDIDDIDMEDSVDTSEEVASDYPDDLNSVIRTMFKECQDKELKSQVKSVIAEYGKLNDVDEDGLKNRSKNSIQSSSR